MTSKKARPKNITEYINAAPREAQEKLREMRACIREAAPSEYVTGDNTIRFPLDKPLPLSPIRKITAFRVKESIQTSQAQTKHWSLAPIVPAPHRPGAARRCTSDSNNTF